MAKYITNDKIGEIGNNAKNNKNEWHQSKKKNCILNFVLLYVIVVVVCVQKTNTKKQKHKQWEKQLKKKKKIKFVCTLIKISESHYKNNNIGNLRNN